MQNWKCEQIKERKNIRNSQDECHSIGVYRINGFACSAKLHKLWCASLREVFQHFNASK